MGISDVSLLDLIDKVGSWITLGASDPLHFPDDIEMPNVSKMCYDCDARLEGSFHGYCCLCCGRRWCGNCMSCPESRVPKDSDERECKRLYRACDGSSRPELGGKCYEKVHPRESPDPPSPSSSTVERNGTDSCQSHNLAMDLEVGDCSSSPHSMPTRNIASIRCYPCRGEEEEAHCSYKQIHSPSSEYDQESSDIDSGSVSARHELFSCKSSGPSPHDSPSRNNFSPLGRSVQHHGKDLSPNLASFDQDPMAVLRKPNPRVSDPDHPQVFHSQEDNKLPQPLEFENNGRIWYPPPPEDENDEAESYYFAYDDEDDNIGDSGPEFSSISTFSSNIPAKEKLGESERETRTTVVHGHFRALVAQLLCGEGLHPSPEDSNWLHIVTTLGWQAANFVKPDTRTGGSMDPGDYVKIKCIASGSPCESVLVKGVVCSKNIKHKRMTSQYKNPRLLLLGGALEYQRAAGQLASFNTLLQQENDHLKMIISKIVSLRPNVLLVEKSVSSYAQQYLLEKEISLVLNVKKPLLERIARCTGALLCPSVDSIASARVGHCELFRTERTMEHHEAGSQSNRKQSKTLMYFEGCPRRLGCTVLLRGGCREELKKVKHVVQFAVFAAYHLSLETSFLADEGASLPRMRLKQPKMAPATIEMQMVETGVSSVTLEDEPVVHMAESLGEDFDPSQLFPSSCIVETDHSDACNDDHHQSDHLDREIQGDEENRLGETHEMLEHDRFDENDVSSEYFSAADSHRSILVSYSSCCVLKEFVCERSRLLRIKFYGSFDKPLGRYLRDDLFDRTSSCRSCKESVDAHVRCYTHQNGNLTINVRRLSSMKLPGEQDGKIWMWHRCLRCDHVDGVPPATRRVVMSDAAWGLSFGKFLDLSFSNHSTANRIASCGHSLQRDCLRFYGFGSMVAFFRYSPIDILTVYLPPSILEFNSHHQQEWIQKETAELMGKMQTMYSEISDTLCSMEVRSSLIENDLSDAYDIQSHIIDLKDQIAKEKDDYNEALQPSWDILELNHLRRALLIGSHAWDRQLYLLNCRIEKASDVKAVEADVAVIPESSDLGPTMGDWEQDVHLDSEAIADDKLVVSQKNTLSPASSLSEKIDSAWLGTCQIIPERESFSAVNSPLRRLTRPLRVHSFDSVLRYQERSRKGLSPSSSSSYLSPLRSFHASGEFRNMVRDPVTNVMRTYSQMLPLEAQKLNLIVGTPPTYVSSASHMADGARLLISQQGIDDIVIPVYDDDPASVISYALSSKEYGDWTADKLVAKHEGESGRQAMSSFSTWRSLGAMDADFIHYTAYGSHEDKKSPHLTVSFSDDSASATDGKVKFSVTCYFAKMFDSLRKKCCPSEVDFVRSLSRCQRWNAQGGKSKVYFAKSLDERFIIKQVVKTELESFEEFASDYFKYLTDSVSSGSPTCLAKILGIYQVSIKNMKGGKETKMDLMVMENLFYKRKISRIYDLKGSARSRYIPNSSEGNKVLLDMNLLETLRTEPIFLGSKAKRSLERAIWNDTSFLASVDVMDYSLLVGIDEERKELVLGIIDFMRQYTWDKHLETWVKASGILGGTRNASPTIISPKQYKKRFRKAMTTYFLTVPDQWSS